MNNFPQNGFSRRQVLESTSCGFGMLALQAMCRQAFGAAATDETTIKPRAKRVIFLCMSGGPAHLDTFDYKPQTANKKHPGSAFKFAQHGASGQWVSELLPETAKQIDQLCVLRGMYCDTGNHSQSLLQLHTGERLRKRPSFGSWVSYGLGTENENLPAFISLNSSKPSVRSSEFLPTIHAGTPIGVNGESMSTASITNIDSEHLPTESKRLQLDFVQSLNRKYADQRLDDERLEHVIESMEMAFRMQIVAPELLDLSQESQATLDRYRVGKNISVGTCRPTDFGRQCLLARRLAEAGVRFIELNHGSWDQHKDHRRDLKANCDTVDAPIAALLADLKARGLLEDTLVIWGGEFGRPGLTPDDGKDETGHNEHGFTFWLAGGGVKEGFAFGRTDETGKRAVEGKIHFRDLHATILHLLGLSHEKLTFHHGGREHRLTGPEKANVIEDIFA